MKDLLLRAGTAGIALTGSNGLPKAMTKTVIVEGRNRANSQRTSSCGLLPLTYAHDRSSLAVRR